MGPLDLGQCSVTFSVEMLVVLSYLLRKPGDRGILESAASLSTLRRGNLTGSDKPRPGDVLVLKPVMLLLPVCLTWSGSCFRVLSSVYFLTSRNVTNSLKL